MTCTFFGHRDTPVDVLKPLNTVLVDLIENQGVKNFYVGNHGAFDAMVIQSLTRMKAVYPHIEWSVVLAYMPVNKPQHTNTVFPAGMETVLPTYAIDARNRWMLKQSTVVVTYVQHSFGGAAKYAALATKHNKIVINLVDVR